jgi:hypothetical protein
MKYREIRINVEELYRRLFAESGYIAMSRSAMGVPDRIVDTMQATDDERRIIDNWIKSSVNETAHAINRHLGSCSVRHCKENDGQEFIISFKAPHNYPDEAIGLLQECAMDLVFKRTMQQWNMAMKPDEASITAAGAQSDALRFRELLAQRDRPTKEKGKTENLIEL